jgi:hypothetical protein
MVKSQNSYIAMSMNEKLNEKKILSRSHPHAHYLCGGKKTMKNQGVTHLPACPKNTSNANRVEVTEELLKSL